MGIRTDGLRALLDALVESVERCGRRGEDVAARAHVSRFHFDRLVTAAIGETPGVFRRRLLLERAAWTLACGGSVGEAAAAGGYDSPEAFARAFKRAFGVAPSRFEGGFLLSSGSSGRRRCGWRPSRAAAFRSEGREAPCACRSGWTRPGRDWRKSFAARATAARGTPPSSTRRAIRRRASRTREWPRTCSRGPGIAGSWCFGVATPRRRGGRCGSTQWEGATQLDWWASAGSFPSAASARWGRT